MSDNRPERKPNMRAGDADRDAVAARLAAALEEGRLDLTEYDQRLDQAMHAKTLGELERLVEDLPISQEELRKEQEKDRARQKQAARRAYLERWRTWFAFAVLFNAIWLVSVISTGEWVQYWPAVPLGIWALFNFAAGPGPDGGHGHGGHDRFR